MDITWFGHSCVRLQSSQATILTDPFEDPPPAALAGIDFVTISDRSRRESVASLAGLGDARIVDGPGEYEIKGVPVSGIVTRRSPDGGEAGKRRNCVYTITLDGMAICHLGRLSEPPSGQPLQEIGSPDVLLIPLGGPEGMPAARAVQLASQLEAKLLIPLTLPGPEGIAALESFCKELGADPTAVERKLSVTATAVAAQTRAALLAPQSATSERLGQSGE